MKRLMGKVRPGALHALRPLLRRGSGLARRAAGLHRNEQGYTMLDYVLVFSFISVPLILLFNKMFEIISEYFSIIAFYVTWPFL